MQTLPIITFRNLETSPAVEAVVDKRIAALEHFSDRITGCEVILEAVQKRKLNARAFSVRVNVQLPGPDLSVTRTVAQGTAQDDLLLAVNRAFTAAEKQLKKQRDVLGRVEVKHHAPEVHGVITELEPELGFGWLKSDDGREVYFQRDSLVAGEWDALERGARMRLRVMEGEKGPFATGLAPAD
jgi:ribosomal subunit interface protein